MRFTSPLSSKMVIPLKRSNGEDIDYPCLQSNAPHPCPLPAGERDGEGDQAFVTSNESWPLSYLTGLMATSIPTFTSSSFFSFATRANNFNPLPKSTTPMWKGGRPSNQNGE